MVARVGVRVGGSLDPGADSVRYVVPEDDPFHHLALFYNIYEGVRPTLGLGIAMVGVGLLPNLPIQKFVQHH